MMQKKILALILAFAMMTSTAATVFAADGGHGDEILLDSGGEWKPEDGGAEGEVAVPKLVMSMPTFDATTLKFDVYNQLNGAQIVSKDLSFTNWSTVPVKITLQKYSAFTSSNNAIVGMKAPADVQSDAARNLFLWFNAAEKDAAGNLIDADTTTAGVQYKYPAVADVLPTTVEARAIETYETGAPVTPAVEAIADPLDFDQIEAGAIPPAGLVGEPIFKDEAEIGTTNKLTMKFDGAINTKGSWAADEKITVIPVFSIEMQPITPVENVTTTSALTIGGTDPSIKIQGKGFEVVSSPTAITGKFNVTTGTTGLTATTYTATATEVTISFTGTIGKGTLTIQPLKGAFTADSLDGKMLVITAKNAKPVISAATSTAFSTYAKASGATLTLTMTDADKIVKDALAEGDLAITIPGRELTLTALSGTVAGDTITITGVKGTGVVAGDVLTVELKDTALLGGDYPLPDAKTITIA